jgi:hypothetical protein
VVGAMEQARACLPPGSNEGRSLRLTTSLTWMADGEGIHVGGSMVVGISLNECIQPPEKPRYRYLLFEYRPASACVPGRIMTPLP